MLKIYTSQFRYSKPDRFDITVKTGNKTFAPTWDIVLGIKQGKITEHEYKLEYLYLLAKSLKENKQEWDKLLSLDQVTFVCYCPKNAFCHRKILADFLVKHFNCEYLGEV